MFLTNGLKEIQTNGSSQMTEAGEFFQQEQEEEEGANAFHAQTKQEVLESPWQ